MGFREQGAGSREQGAGNRQEARGKRQEVKKSCVPHYNDILVIVFINSVR